MYRCPTCRKSINAIRIEGSRWLFSCKCGISRVIDKDDRDEAYIELLKVCDEKDRIGMEELLIREGLIRSMDEIEDMLKYADDTLAPILKSKEDYIVYYKILQEREPEVGRSVDEVDIVEQ